MTDGIWKVLTPALLALGYVATAGATTIEWGSSSSATSPLHIDSGGDPVAATINIELGIFDAGFDPRSESPATWFDAWISLDSASYNEGGSFFSSSYEADNPAVEGRQAYIWLFTDPNPTAGSEWALITDGDGQGGNDWIFPAKSFGSSLIYYDGAVGITTIFTGKIPPLNYFDSKGW